MLEQALGSMQASFWQGHQIKAAVGGLRPPSKPFPCSNSSCLLLPAGQQQGWLQHLSISRAFLGGRSSWLLVSAKCLALHRCQLCQSCVVNSSMFITSIIGVIMDFLTIVRPVRTGIAWRLGVSLAGVTGRVLSWWQLIRDMTGRQSRSAADCVSNYVYGVRCGRLRGLKRSEQGRTFNVPSFTCKQQHRSETSCLIITLIENIFAVVSHHGDREAGV
jgi:hypothetical protein